MVSVIVSWWRMRGKKVLLASMYYRVICLERLGKAKEKFRLFGVLETAKF
jgi:hypothetical protein